MQLDRSATFAKHVGKFNNQIEIEFLPKLNTENSISLKALRISGISAMPQDGEWPTTHNAAPFLGLVVRKPISANPGLKVFNF